MIDGIKDTTTSRVRHFALAAALLAGMQVAAHAGAAGSSSAQFLKIAPGARAAGMGEAYCGLSDDVDAVVWNPAGLVQLNTVQQTFMHNAWFEGINQDYAAVAGRINDRSAFGVAVEYVNVGDIPRVDRTGNDKGSYNAYDLMGAFSYARQLRQSLSVGASFKVVQEKIESETARAFALDAGIMYLRSDRWRFGCSVRNAGTAVTFRETGYPLPMDIRAGVCYQPRPALLIVSDIDMPSDSSANLHLGAEYWYRKIKGMEVAVRGGFKSGTMTDLGATAGISLGFGVRWSNWGADYALAPYGVLGMSQRLNFTLRFRTGAVVTAAESAKKVEIIIKEGGQERVTTPEEMYQTAIAWFKAKVEKEKLTPAEQRSLLERMKQKFEPLGVNVSALDEMLKGIPQ